MAQEAKQIVGVVRNELGIVHVDEYRYGGRNGRRLAYIDYHVLTGKEIPLRFGIVEFERDKKGQVVRAVGFRDGVISINKDDIPAITELLDSFLAKLAEIQEIFPDTKVVPQTHKKGRHVISEKLIRELPRIMLKPPTAQKPPTHRHSKSKAAQPS